MFSMFDNDDSDYSSLLTPNFGGYVVNMRHGYSPSYMVLHRGSCATVNPRTSSSDPGAFIERDYLKVCSTDLESLRSLLKAFGRPNGSFSAESSKCLHNQGYG